VTTTVNSPKMSSVPQTISTAPTHVTARHTQTRKKTSSAPYSIPHELLMRRAGNISKGPGVGNRLKSLRRLWKQTAQTCSQN
jgi:hypothetical protein